MADLNAVGEQPKLIHRSFISEIPGIGIEDMRDGIIGPIPIGKDEKPPSYAENKHYKQIVSYNDLKNCSTDTNDVKKTRAIVGPH